MGADHNILTRGPYASAHGRKSALNTCSSKHGLYSRPSLNIRGSKHGMHRPSPELHGRPSPELHGRPSLGLHGRMPLGLHGRPPLALQSGHHPEAQIDRCGQSASAENSSAKHSRKYRAHLYLSGLNRAHASVRVVADDRNSSRSRLTYVQAALADQQAVAPELLAALREADRTISRGLNRTYASVRVVADDRNSSRSKLTYVLAALADRQAVALELLAELREADRTISRGLNRTYASVRVVADDRSSSRLKLTNLLAALSDRQAVAPELLAARREADRTICRVFVTEHVTVESIGAAVAKEKSPAASNPTLPKNQKRAGWSTQRGTWIGVASESEIADGLTPVVKTTSGHAVAQNLAHAPEGPDGNGGDVALELTSPLSTYCSATGGDDDGGPGSDDDGGLRKDDALEEDGPPGQAALQNKKNVQENTAGGGCATRMWIGAASNPTPSKNQKRAGWRTQRAENKDAALEKDALEEDAPEEDGPPDSASVMERLFPEIFGAAKRPRAAEQSEDICHCGELAQRTCPCGARTCHNHFYDGEGNLARGDEQGFCAECVDLIREEAAGIERCGRTQ